MSITYLRFSILILILVVTSVFAAGNWELTGSTNYGHIHSTATLLQNGKVLVVGGRDYICQGASGGINKVELYDPVTSTWENTGSLNAGRYIHTATLLSNGKVLVVGGYNINLSYALNSAELYDPSTGTWQYTGSLNESRTSHEAVLLPNGKVLVVGGRHWSGGNAVRVNAELYDPVTGTWTTVPGIGGLGTTVTLLSNGKVLVAGGWDGIVATVSAKLYDCSTNTWSNTGSLNHARSGHTATLLNNGMVLVVSGSSTDTRSAELYNPSTGVWTETGSLNNMDQPLFSLLLPSGKVLASCACANVSAFSNELYDPYNGTWENAESLNIKRLGHIGTLLQDGRVLVVGGSGDCPSSTILSSAEIYTDVLPPLVVSTVRKYGTENEIMTFHATDFTNAFSRSSSLSKIKISSLPDNGLLKLNGSDVVVDQEIPVTDLNNLAFVPLSDWFGNDKFTWNGSNGTMYAINDADVNVTLTVSYPVVDNMVKTENMYTPTTFSVNDFVNNFNDTSCKALEKIRIGALPTNGMLKLSGNKVSNGQEINVENLGNFTYIPLARWFGTDRFSWYGSSSRSIYSLYPANVTMTIDETC